MNISPTNALGFFTAQQMARTLNVDDDKRTKTVALMTNIVRLVRYIPIIGTITAVAELIINRNNWGKYRDNFGESCTRATIARTVVEALSLGILLLIPDIIATAARFFQK
jgi:hypothetical protein